MPEMAPLTSITIRALRMAWRGHFVWWIAIPIGTLIGISSYAAEEIQHMLSDSSNRSVFLHTLTHSSTISLMGLSLFAACIQSALRGPLVLLLGRVRKEKWLSRQKRISRTEYFRALFVSLACDLVYWLMLIAVVSLFAIPCLAAWRFNPPILGGILEIGLLLFLVISIYLYCIKELAFLYTILGHVRLFPALDLGFRLYRRQTFNSTLFFFYAALLALFFALLIEICTAISGVSELRADRVLSLVLSLPFGLYYVFDQALRVSFFHSIATPPKKPATTEAVLEPRESQSGVVPS
ncbi:MAG: hypothetical protein WAT81_02810 [Candidatus Moraniibacteriota bacterium]